MDPPVSVAPGGAVDRTERGESRALTGLRGVGALLVMLHHFFLHLGLDLHMPMLAGLLRKGYLGVDLFFVLSGFVIAMVYGPWFAPDRPGQPTAMAVFLVRRVARIWPLHAAMVAVLVAEQALSGGGVSPHLVATNLALVQAWGFSSEINAPAWSISVEVVAYLLFPLVLVPWVLRARWGVLLGVAAVVAAVAVCQAYAPPIGSMRRGRMDIYFNYSTLPMLRCLAGFVLGLVAWRLGRTEAVRRAATNGWVGPGGLALMIALMLGRVNDLVIYPLLPLIVLGLHFGQGPAWSVLAYGPVHRLGVISYAVYLVHAVLLLWFPFGWGPLWLELPAFLLVTLGVAGLANRLIERPSRRVVRAAGESILARLLPGPDLQPGRGSPM